MDTGSIVISGAREHNLKNITVRIPRNGLTVITGLSGSGKSTLAFDTLYAEGQRRYVESLSVYARQFLEQLRKPDVDSIEGLSPAIAIEQRTAGSNPRSIVATATEIHDYLRLLFAHVGQRHCPKCGKPVARQSSEEIIRRLLELPTGTRLSLLAPLVRGRKGGHEDVLEAARQQGYIRVRIDGVLGELEPAPVLNPKQAHTIEVVIDRLVMADGIRTRLADSVELALQRGGGLLVAVIQERKVGTTDETDSTDGGMKSVKSVPSAVPLRMREEIFSEKHACLACGISYPELDGRSFSFNSPEGACPTCAGLGTQWVMDEALIVPDPTLSLDDGAIQAWRKGGRRLIIYYKQQLRAVAKHHGVGMDVPFKDLPVDFRKILMHGSGTEEIEYGFWRGGAHRKGKKAFEGVIPNLWRRHQTSESQAVRMTLRRYMNRQTCPTCGGARLRPEVLACTVGGKSIVGVTGLAVRHASEFFDGLVLTDAERHIAGEVLREIQRRLKFLDDVGLGYLALDRESGSLSGGELQRIRLATQIGSGLVGVVYVLDEPTVGLHARDTQRLIKLLQALRDAGNTVVVVEHDAAVIRSADHIIDLGPGAGRLGGEVLAEGPLNVLLKSERSETARYMRADLKEAASRRSALQQSESTQVRNGGPSAARPNPTQVLRVQGAAAHNLKNIDVDFPLGQLVCVTGVSGSGKSTLVDDILRRALFTHFYGAKEKPGKHRGITGLKHLDKSIVIDQSAVGRTPRSNPATYTGAFDEIRKLFASTPAAKVRGYGPARFSFNVKGGRCEACKGDGVLRLEMHFLPDVYVPCKVCAGKRYNHETLQVHVHGKSIDDVLGLTVDEASEVFRNIPAIARKLVTLAEVGLGYLQLGQSATTLSGGEAQRLKLAAELSRQATGRTLYLLDEPTTGLHFSDVARLMAVLQRLRDAGNSIVVIEHNLDVIGVADYIIDLGPEGGEGGGRVVVCGTPAEVAACPSSYTGQALREVAG